VKHNLLVPFAQQDPLDTGTGLGLSLVQSAVQALGGETKIDTDESRGTEVSVILPRLRLTGEENAPALEEPASSMATQDLPALQARLFAPTRWHREDDLRHQRCIESLNSSLGRTLQCWLNMDFGVWNCEELPDVMFVLYADLDKLEAMTKNHFRTMHKVVLCSDLQAEKSVKESSPGIYTTIVGPITSSKVCAAVLSRPERLENGDSAHTGPSHGSITENSTNNTDESRDENDSTAISLDNRTGSIGVDQVNGSAEHTLPDRTVAKAPDLPTEPRFLLVDDNAINLKVIGMYAKKCSKRPSASAGGGQEAIDAFKLASLAPSHDRTPENRFDIILLDLSMPEVSGFDVAAAVRKFEHENGSRRTYIAALTGLVSDKDRAAAFAAGVDEYVTKPATLKDVQGVVASWRAASEAPP